MFFVLVITVVFVIISIYFFFRAEKLQRELISQQRESLGTRKENKLLVESITLVATREQEFSKAKLQRLKAYAKANNSEQLMLHTELISPLINNYSIIFRECLKGKGRLKAVSQKCFENQDSSAYKKFVALIVTSDKKLKRYWSSDNLNGFLLLVDALLTMDNDNDNDNDNLPIKNKKSNCHS
jgi:hypothetical protein